MLNKVYFLLIAIFCFCGISQGQEVNISAKDRPLNEVLEEVSKQANIRLSFDANELSKHFTSINFSNKPIDEALEELLKPFHFQAKRTKKNFYFIYSSKREKIFVLRDKNTGEVVPFANLNLKNTFKGNSTNALGIGRLSYDKRDTAILVSAFGYQTQEVNPSHFTGDTIKIELEITTINLKTVTILEYINHGIRLKEDISSPELILSDMEVLPGLPEADALLSAQMLPGFESSNENAADINVRGSDPSQTLVYWDRIPVYKAAHYFGQITSIIPSMTDKIIAYKNYIPSSFTGATSGLLNMYADDSLSSSTQFRSNTTFTHTELDLKSPMGDKLAIQIGGRFSYNHILITPLFDAYSNKLFEGFRTLDGEDEDSEIDSELKFWDINAKVIFQPNSKNYFSFSSILNDDQMNYLGSDKANEGNISQDHLEAFRGFNAFYKHQFNKKWSSSISLSRTDYEAEDQTVDLFSDVDFTEFDSSFIHNKLNTIEVKSAFQYNGWKRHQLEFGYQLYYFETSLWLRENSTYEAAAQENRSTIETSNGIYIQSEWQANDQWLVRPQIRLDYFSREEQFIVSPVINTQYDLKKGFWLKGSLGRYAQALSSIDDANLTASNVNSSIWVLAGEEDTDVLQSLRGSIGILYNSKGWIIDLDYYNKRVNGISAINLFDTGLGEELDFELGESKSSGIDVMIKKDFGRYDSWLSYTYSNTENTFDSLGNSFSSSLDRPHQFRWVHTYIVNQFEFSLGFMYKSGSPYTRAVEAEYDPDVDEYNLIYGNTNQYRLPNYQRLDFSFWYRFKAEEKAIDGLIGFSLMNILNRENVWKRFYRLEDLNDDEIPEVNLQERYFLGLTPNLTFRLNF